MTSRKLHSIHNKQLRIEKRKEEKDKPATSKAYMEDLSRRTKIQKIKVETDAYSIASDSNHLPLSPHHLLSQESTTSSVRRKSPRKIVQKSSVRDKYRPFVNLDHPTISMSDKKKYRWELFCKHVCYIFRNVRSNSSKILVIHTVFVRQSKSIAIYLIQGHQVGQWFNVLSHFGWGKNWRGVGRLVR